MDRPKHPVEMATDSETPVEMATNSEAPAETVSETQALLDMLKPRATTAKASPNTKKTPKYLSPTSLRLLETNPNDYYLRYILGVPRSPQTKPMAIGSAFDARVKARLTEDVLGQSDIFEQLFETQVEKPLQDWCREHSAKILQDYIACGAYVELLNELKDADSVRFEFDAEIAVSYDDGFSVPIFGKPDFYAHLKSGANLIYDWKVNGYCSKASPHPGSVRLYESTGQTKAYDAGTLMFHGIPYNAMATLKPEWEDQLLFYIMSAADPQHAADPWLAGIEQLAFLAPGRMRVAQHRLIISENKFEQLRLRLRRAWEGVLSGHYFLTVSRDENDARIAGLDRMDPSIRFAALYR